MSHAARALRSLLCCAALLTAALAPAAPARCEEDYPSRPLRLIVPFPPAGSTDLSARSVAEKLGQRLGQPVVIENKSGAGGSIGAAAAAHAPADGYTLLVGTVGTHAINASLYPDLPYDPVKDFDPVVLLSTTPNVLVVYPGLPVHSVQELIALARAKPGELSFASSGSGTSIHLSGELFKTLAGIELQHIPYRGSGAMLLDVMSGQVSLSFDNLSAAMPYIRAGKLRALAVTTAARAPALPELPTVAEAGLPGYETSSWNAIFVPAGTPRARLERLAHELGAILQSAATRRFFAEQGAEAGGGTPEALGSFVRAETEKWARAVKASGARPD